LIPLADHIPALRWTRSPAAELGPGVGATGTERNAEATGGGWKRRKRGCSSSAGGRAILSGLCAVSPAIGKGQGNGSPWWCCGTLGHASEMGRPFQFIKGGWPAGRAPSPGGFGDALVGSRWGRLSPGKPRTRTGTGNSSRSWQQVAAPVADGQTQLVGCSMKINVWPCELRHLELVQVAWRLRRGALKSPMWPLTGVGRAGPAGRRDRPWFGKNAVVRHHSARRDQSAKADRGLSRSVA